MRYPDGVHSSSSAPFKQYLSLSEANFRSSNVVSLFVAWIPSCEKCLLLFLFGHIVVWEAQSVYRVLACVLPTFVYQAIMEPPNQDSQSSLPITATPSDAVEVGNASRVHTLRKSSRPESTIKSKFQTASSAQNIVVSVRIRPRSSTSREPPIWSLNAKEGQIKLSEHHPLIKQRGGSSGKDTAYDFRFDSIIPPDQTTEDLYNQQIGRVVKAAIDGFNGTVFAYGQTGSGKTHSKCSHVLQFALLTIP